MRSGLLWVLVTALGSVAAIAAESEHIPASPLAIRFSPAAIDLPRTRDHRVELASGPVAYIVEDHTVPLVELAVALPIGSFLDPPDLTGISFLAGSELRRAGSGDLSPTDFDERVDDLGARIDSYAGLTRAGASLSIPSWALEEGLDLFFSALSSPRFDGARLRTARGNLLESLKRRNEEPLEVLQREWEFLLAGDDHFSTRPLTPATIAAIDSDALLAFHRRYWRPESMIVAASGDFVTADLVAELEKRFASWRDRFDGPRLDLPTAAAPGQSSDRGLFYYQMEIPQAKILLGHRLDEFVPWLDERRFALEVLAEILGGSGAVSRIAGRLRTYEGLVYRASADLDPGSIWPGELQVFFETANANVARALSHAMEEIDRMHHELVHPKELEVAQKTILAQIRLAFDQSEQAAGLLAENELLARPDSYWQDYLEGVLAVTPADVREAAREFLNTDRLVCVIVGTWAEITASEQQRDTLRDVFDSAPQHLPARDPLTLVPLSAPDPGTRSEQRPR